MGRLVSAGAGEDVSLVLLFEAVGIDNFQFPYEAAWLGVWDMLKSLQGRDSSSAGFLPNSQASFDTFPKTFASRAPPSPPDAFVSFSSETGGHQIQASSTSLLPHCFSTPSPSFFGRGMLPSFQKQVHLTR